MSCGTSGEVVDSQHLIDPSQATTVRFQNGAPAPTDGPFAEIKESLAGYWIIEASRRAGASRSRRRSSRSPSTRWRSGGSWTSRADGGATADDAASRTCCANSRRRSSARWYAGTGSSTPARTPCRRRCSPPRCSGRPTASRTARGPGCSPSAAPGAGRPLAHRQRPPPTGGDRRGARTSGRDVAAPRPGRHAGAAVPVLPSGAVPAVAARAHPAGGRRADHRARSPPRSWCRRPRWRSGSAGPSSASATPGPGSSCRRRPSAAGRLGVVLHVLYLIFNEGYTASSGPELHRTDLTTEAIRLTRLLHRLLPGETRGRRAARVDAAHRRPPRRPHRRATASIVPLAEQDREPLERRRDRRGRALLTRTLGTGPVGPYQIQAAIAAVHDEAADRRGHRLAADPRPVRRARPGRAGPGGHAQPRRRAGHGARPARRARPARHPRRRRADGAHPPPRSRPRAPARTGRRPGRRPASPTCGPPG